MIENTGRRAKGLLDRLTQIQNKADREGRDMTRAEADEFERLAAEFELVCPAQSPTPSPEYFARLRLQMLAATSGRR